VTRLFAFLPLLSLILTSPATAAPIVAAHRGVTGPGQVDNGIEAIRRAANAGVDAVEIDLRSTADGTLVLFHDARIDVPGRGRLAVERLALADLVGKDGSPVVATFEQALEATRGTATRLLLDLKHPGAIQPLQILQIASRHAAIERIIIGARTAAEVRAYRQLAPSLSILGFVKSQADIDSFVAAGADIIRLWPPWLSTPAAGCRGGASSSCLVQRLQRRSVRVWALADAPPHEGRAKACFAALVGLQLDGILTNRPLLAREASRGSIPAASHQPDLRQCD
jgi:glycerophosphoryl diester phosphodiesterase